MNECSKGNAPMVIIALSLPNGEAFRFSGNNNKSPSVNKIYYTAQITALLRGIKVIVFPFLGVILSKLSPLYG